MARPRQCDNCEHVPDGSLRGRVSNYQISLGYATYEVDLCDGHTDSCFFHVRLSDVPEIGRRVGPGHLPGAEQLANLPIVLPRAAV
jgi:hypothetical protein